MALATARLLVVSICWMIQATTSATVSQPPIASDSNRLPQDTFFQQNSRYCFVCPPEHLLYSEEVAKNYTAVRLLFQECEKSYDRFATFCFANDDGCVKLTTQRTFIQNHVLTYGRPIVRRSCGKLAEYKEGCTSIQSVAGLSEVCYCKSNKCNNAWRLSGVAASSAALVGVWLANAL